MQLEGFVAVQGKKYLGWQLLIKVPDRCDSRCDNLLLAILLLLDHFQ